MKNLLSEYITKHRGINILDNVPSFSDMTFTGNISFLSVDQCDCEIIFNRCTFDQDFGLISCFFFREVAFIGCTFQNIFTIGACNFQSKVTFERNTFQEKLEFRDSEFGEKTSFVKNEYLQGSNLFAKGNSKGGIRFKGPLLVS